MSADRIAFAAIGLGGSTTMHVLLVEDDEDWRDTSVLVGRLRQVVCTCGATGIGLGHSHSIGYGISICPSEQLEWPELIAGAIRDTDGELVVARELSGCE